MEKNTNNTLKSKEVNTELKVNTAAKSLQWLLVFAIFYTLYFAQSLVIPIVFTALTALLLSPLVALLKKVHIPRSISAVLLLTMLVAPFTFLGAQLAEPAQKWAQLIPKLSVELSEQIDSMSEAYSQQEALAKKQVEAAKQEEKSGFSFFGWFDDEEPEPVQNPEQSAVKEHIKQGGIEMLLSVLGATPTFIGQLLASLILILFLLIFGPSLFNVFIQDFPIVKDKKRTVFLVTKIQQTLSQYIVTISIINSALGLSTAAILHLLGVQDALLWGSIVALLNFVPYVGSLISLIILCLAGTVQFGFELIALMPSGVFLILNIIESQFITPAVLGRNMQVNPLVIILWLLMFGWLWGILGILLAVPILVCIKLAFSQLGILPHWLKLIEAKD
ncbi:AI-2E family transporter [Aliiglaciecola lipolytica]|uniref:Transport protein n=1 Tax=Aliiglaciecola lipolytica E3 TaxID=1127673 RepID=K6YBT1_9ALTE|nr:AI-2E family transporter [Aliiglaciecola lipolytica]GAC14103.1 transport protein [Aliiglaciecola lipolytica E3]